MAASELSIEIIHEFLLKYNGVVANREAVKYFRHYLTDPSSKDDARAKFKKYVNILATTRSEGDEKFLVLKPKYFSSTVQLPSPNISAPSARPPPPPVLSPYSDPRIAIGIPASPPEYVPSSPTHSIQSNQSMHSNQSPLRQPPPYRHPPPVTPPQSDTISISSLSSYNDYEAPAVPPRRRSQDKMIVKQQEPVQSASESKSIDAVNEADEDSGAEKPTVSVKERTQKFNRLASTENELSSSPQHAKEKPNKKEKGSDEDDGATLASMLEPKKCTEWWVNAAKADYQELCRLAKMEPRLVKLKATVLHWAAKHGNADIVKHFAGKYKCDVNAKTNGGYTPLHLAAQFGHDQLYNLLVDVFKADKKIRDFSGRLPSQYKNQEKSQIGTKDTYRKIKARKKLSDKDLGFLRIGSLNVRVKKTTEAFSNFLGVVSAGSVAPVDNMSDKVHKSWGSADNLAKENNMPAPKGFITRRKAKRPTEMQSSSTPGTPNQPAKVLNATNNSTLPDSDSDTACGFDSNWNN